MVGEHLLSARAGWLGIAAAAVIVVGTVLQSVLPDTPWVFAFYLVAGILLLIWFAWTGAAQAGLGRLPEHVMQQGKR